MTVPRTGIAGPRLPREKSYLFFIVYNVAAPEELIRAAAGEMLARYFARLPVLDVLGESRERFIRAFQTELQSRLTTLSTGVEVMGVVVEAIHPPPAAAPAYQGVQTAAIRSVTHIAEARAEATQTLSSAQSTAGHTAQRGYSRGGRTGGSCDAGVGSVGG
jgi:regulator of protease activity HflC (stomatin/prohibitin superfamily)